MDNGTIASTAPVNTQSNSGSAGWAADDFKPTADPTVPGGVSDLPPPAYSEHQPHDGPRGNMTLFYGIVFWLRAQCKSTAYSES